MGVIVVLFAASGCAALIYEIVWFQLLQLRIGATTFSIGLLLAAYMGGMCLGSLLFPSLVGSKHHPLRVYALLEFGIALCGIAVLFFPAAGIVATLLMGATLPAISRWVETTPEGMSWLGFFYGGNIAGAVFGCLLAGFYLLRVYDMMTATIVAVIINISVGLAAFALSTRSARPAIELETAPAVRVAGLTPVYTVISLSGFAALAAEVVWTRQLALLFGATVYTFSIILATFLIGLGLGSGIASLSLRTTQQSRRALGLCQALLPLAIAWAAWAIANSLPVWPVHQPDAFDPWQLFEGDLIRSAFALLPAASLWGASFPLALGSIRSCSSDKAHFVSRIYSANTLGGIAGALLFSMLVIPLAGTHQAERLLMVISAAGAAIIVVSNSFSLRNSLAAAMILATTCLLAWKIPAMPDLAIAYGRDYATRVTAPPEILYVGEGRNSSIAVSEWPNGIRNFHVAGKVEASTEAKDMRLERMLGHLSALMHAGPRSVLVVGFGAGITAGTFTRYPGIERIVICEIEPLVPQVVSTFFRQQNDSVLDDPRVEIVFDDARHFIRTTSEKFDVITSDPIHPWVKGAATLYTTDYFEMVKSRLNPGGIVSQWVPLYDSSEAVVKSEFATFFGVFPDGGVWSNDIAGRGYDVILISNTEIEPAAHRLESNPHAMASLDEVGFATPAALFGTYARSGSALIPWLQGAQINTDRNLRLQYIAGMGAVYDDPDGIFHSFMKVRRP